LCYIAGVILGIFLSKVPLNLRTLIRLLECNSHGTFNLIKFVEIDISRYAILSHIWGAERATKLFLKISRKVLGVLKLDIIRSGSAENKLKIMAFGISG
jgi:hypothetical protein